MKLLLFLLTILLLTSSTALAQVRVMAGDIKETRRTDGFFNKLEIELKLLGDPLADAKAIRVKVQTAVDETGRNLIPERDKGDEFTEISEYNRSAPKIDIELKNPARQATQVNEVAGVIELYMPGKDPASILTIANLLSATGKPLVSPALKAAGIEITVWNKEQFDARKKSEEARLRKEAESKKKEAAAELGEEVVEGLMKVFGGLFSAMTEMDENGIALQVSDKQSKIIKFEFQSADGKELSYNGRSITGNEPKTIIFNLEQKLPPTARLKIYIYTPKAVLKVPFKLTNIPLP